MPQYKIKAVVEILIDTDDDVPYSYVETVVKRNLSQTDIFALGIRTIKSEYNKIMIINQ